ncbi:MAG: hypothetical protein V3S60_07620 [Acidimicrobiia bacterium]
MRRYIGTGLIMLTLLSACGIDSESVRVGHLPLCDYSNTGRLILMAQSVPSAQVIPCIEALPDGWRLKHADVETGRSRLQFDNAAGADVVVYLLTSCSPIGELVGSESGVDRNVALEGKSRVEEQVFEGGCIRIESPVGEEPGRMADAIGSITRDALREGSGWEL